MAILNRVGAFLVTYLDKCLGLLAVLLTFLIVRANPGLLSSPALLFDCLALIGLLCLAAIIVQSAILRSFLTGSYGQVIRATAKGVPGAYRPYFEGELAAVFAFMLAALSSVFAWPQVSLLALDIVTAGLFGLSVSALVGALLLVRITVIHNHMRLRLVGMMEHWSAAVKAAATPNPS
jgi:hypothetical protein